MIWAYIYGLDGKPLLVCPAMDAQLWGLLECGLWFRYVLIEDAEP